MMRVVFIALKLQKEIEGSGSLLGYRMMRIRLIDKYGITARRCNYTSVHAQGPMS